MELANTGIFSMFWGWEEAQDSLTVSIVAMLILIIGPLTLGFLWLAPYFYTTSAAFYEEISKEYYKKEDTTF